MTITTWSIGGLLPRGHLKFRLASAMIIAVAQRRTEDTKVLQDRNVRSIRCLTAPAPIWQTQIYIGR